MRKGIKNSKGDAFFAFAFNVQSILFRIGLFLMVFLVVIQIFHYYHFLHGTHGPSYSFKDYLTGNNNSMSSYGAINFTANIKNNDIVIIKMNGIPVKKMERDKPTSIYVTSLDVLEIDATRARGSYEVIIEAEPSSFLPDDYIKELKVHGKLYRLPPLY